MCGIAGILSSDPNNVSRTRLQKMTNAIVHRGPEGEGFWQNEEGTVGLGHRRLSIIDLSDAGAQPKRYIDRYTITYNGEIYNYLEIKYELEKKGFAFTSRCDTEVVLAAYAAYGIDCLQHFDGMFAFALWDQQEKTLFCARDRFGEKPLYYYLSSAGNELVFASEMKAIWSAGIPRQMDNRRLLHYLAVGAVQNAKDPFQTFFKDINNLPPAHYLVGSYTAGQISITIKSYWDIDKTVITNDCSNQVQKQFIKLLGTSVQRRLRSDVPIGSSLSGRPGQFHYCFNHQQFARLIATTKKHSRLCSPVLREMRRYI